MLFWKCVQCFYTTDILVEVHTIGEFVKLRYYCPPFIFDLSILFIHLTCTTHATQLNEIWKESTLAKVSRLFCLECIVYEGWEITLYIFLSVGIQKQTRLRVKRWLLDFWRRMKMKLAAVTWGTINLECGAMYSLYFFLIMQMIK